MLLFHLRRFRPRLRTLRMGLAVLALLPLALMVDGCDNVPLFAPSDATITLAAGTQTMALNEVTDLRAFVTQSGGAPVHNGTVVYFSSSLGSMLPDHAETTDGVARVQFSAGNTVGQAQLSAVSGAAKLSAALTITITSGGVSVSRIVLLATPGFVPVGGGSVTLTATVEDVGGNPVQGLTVLFTASAGTLSQPSAISDRNGVATVTLTTSAQTTVTAEAGGATATTVVTVQ
jgi:adhesin/invasin